MQLLKNPHRGRIPICGFIKRSRNFLLKNPHRGRILEALWRWWHDLHTELKNPHRGRIRYNFLYGVGMSPTIKKSP